MSSVYEERLIARVVERGGGVLQPDHVRCMFAVLRSFARKVESPIPPSLDGVNRFLVASGRDDQIVIIGLEVSLKRADALNLLTWIALVGAFSERELEDARTAALRED